MLCRGPACPRLRWFAVFLFVFHIHLSAAITPEIVSDTSSATPEGASHGSVDLLARGIALLDDESMEEVPFEEEASASVGADSHTAVGVEGRRHLLSDSIDEAIENLENARAEMNTVEGMPRRPPSTPGATRTACAARLRTTPSFRHKFPPQTKCADQNQC